MSGSNKIKEMEEALRMAKEENRKRLEHEANLRTLAREKEENDYLKSKYDRKVLWVVQYSDGRQCSNICQFGRKEEANDYIKRFCQGGGRYEVESVTYYKKKMNL